jgi:hypothetical protein
MNPFKSFLTLTHSLITTPPSALLYRDHDRYILSLSIPSSVYSHTLDSVVGRISALSSTLTRTVALILLAALLPAVKADNCWFDEYVSR